MRDIVALVTITVAFATLVTSHVALSFKLARAKPLWRGLVAFVLPPLAPIWGFRAGFRKLGGLWLGAVGVYIVGLVVAQG